MEKVKLLKKFKIKLLLIFIFTFLILLLFYDDFNGIRFTDYIKLKVNGTIVQAKVVDTRIDKHDIILSYKSNNTATVTDGYYVKYQIHSQGNEKSATESNWFPVPEKDWRYYSKSTTIDVVYNRGNPDINAPLILMKKYMWSLWGVLIKILFGSSALCFTVGAVMYWDLKKRRYI